MTRQEYYTEAGWDTETETAESAAETEQYYEEAEKAPARHSPAPSMGQLEQWMDEGGCEATDGCWVEEDGTCPHGKQSWFLHLGLI